MDSPLSSINQKIVKSVTLSVPFGVSNMPIKDVAGQKDQLENALVVTELGSIVSTTADTVLENKSTREGGKRERERENVTGQSLGELGDGSY